MDELQFRDDDGFDIFYRRWLPARDPTLVVLVSHGMSEHSRRYTRLANALVDRGYGVFAPDHRGHGRTAASTGVGRAGATGMDGVLADLEQLGAIAHEQVGAVPTVLFGHSMGALIAQAYAERHGSDLIGLALSGSAGASDGMQNVADMMQHAVDAGMADEPIAALSIFSEAFQPARTPFDWLSRDEREVDAYIADPFCGYQHPMTYGLVATVTGMGLDAMSPAGIAMLPKSLPILLLTGESDPSSNMAANVRELERRMRQAGLAVEALYYPGARHELLNETNRDEVQADLLAWIERVAAESLLS